MTPHRLEDKSMKIQYYKEVLRLLLRQETWKALKLNVLNNDPVYKVRVSRLLKMVRIPDLPQVKQSVTTRVNIFFKKLHEEGVVTILFESGSQYCKYLIVRVNDWGKLMERIEDECFIEEEQEF